MTKVRHGPTPITASQLLAAGAGSVTRELARRLRAGS